MFDRPAPSRPNIYIPCIPFARCIMSPRRTPPTSGNSRSGSPYSPPRDSYTKNKTKKREQFSACGACRMRRVRCDLKDLPMSPSGQHPPCSNCKERGLKCVDEFAEVKAVKMLRRGRRLQQVEAVYGKTSPEEPSLHNVIPPPNVIPRIRPEFFSSSFFRRLHIQRPVLEPIEFQERYNQSLGNPNILGITGQLICYTLVVWAASFGIDEYGREVMSDNIVDAQQRTDMVREMLQELLYLVDLHGVLRKPSWDGARLLLLLLPLAQEVQTPAERLVMQETALLHTHAQCSASSSSPNNVVDYIDAAVKARVFWYGYILDGVTSGLRGGRLLFNHDDLKDFEQVLPQMRDGSSASAVYALAHTYASVPIRISDVCRQLHTLTAPKARRSLAVDEESLNYAWNTLDRCWKELDDIRRQIGSNDQLIDVEDMERFINAWQIKIFECHYLIREALKQRLGLRQTYPSNPTFDASQARNDIIRLHDSARQRCHSVVRNVVTIIQRNLGTSFFQFDAALVRDGCFFAGFLLAQEGGSQAEVDACLNALKEIRWVFCRSEDRMFKIRSIWEARISHPRMQDRNSPESPTGDLLDPLLCGDISAYRRGPTRSNSNPSLPLLSLPSLPSSSSAPNTAFTEDGAWPISTPAKSRPGSHHGSIPSHHGSPPGTLGCANISASSQEMSGLTKSLSATTVGLISNASHPISFTRSGDVADPYYYQTYDYANYGETSDLGLDTQASSSASTSYHPPPFISGNLSYANVLTSEPSADFHAPSGDDTHSSSYVTQFYQ